MTPIPSPPPQSSWPLVRRLMREAVRPYLLWLVAAIGCMILVAAGQSAAAYLMKPMVNQVFVAANPDMLWPIGGAVLFTFIVKGIAQYGQSTLMSRVGQRIITDTQIRLYGHLLTLDLAFFHAHASATLTSRFTNDINMMRGAVSNTLTGFGKDALTLIGLIGVMFFQNFELGLIAFLVFPIAVLPVVRLGQRMRRVTANTQQQMGGLMALLDQTFLGIRHVKSYGMEDYERHRMAELADGIFQLIFRADRVRAAASPLMETLGGVAIAGVVVYGGYQVVGGTTDAGSFFSFITAALMAYEPAKRLANLNATLQQGLASAERLFHVLDQQPSIDDAAEAQSLNTVRGEIAFEQVTFGYDQGALALDQVSLVVPAGRTVALVGPSGAGKSTVLNLIPRFYDPLAGAVTLDGIDLRQLRLKELRAASSLVSQEIALFDDTVRANIAYGRPDASEDQIITAARNASADDFIRQLPEGYDTVVGEQGVRLSGGQRQRLAIARAILKDAPILLLDEATSALDSESERNVQAALERLMQGRTTLVIAHRLSTVVNADLIYVMDGGRVIEQGRHDELLAQDGVYAHLHALQFASQDAVGNAASAEE